MPVSTLVIANNVAKISWQMAKDIRTWEEYVNNPLATSQQLAEKAKDMGLINGMPFTLYQYQDEPLIEIDLQSVDDQFEMIQHYCDQLAPYHSIFDSQRIKQIKVDMAGKYGFIRICPTLCKKLQLIYDFVNTLEDQLIEAIFSGNTGKEKLHFYTISKLIDAFHRNYLHDIPDLLKAINLAPTSSLYLYDYEQAIEEPNLYQQIEILARERRNSGNRCYEIQ